MAKKEKKSGNWRGLTSKVGDMAKTFGKEVWKELWGQLTKSTARIIILLVTIGLLGGYTLFDRLQNWQEQQRELVERCIEGHVIDGLWGTVVDSVRVGVVGIGTATDLTNMEGEFTICFDLPKNEETVDLSFSKNGYVPDVFYQEAIPLGTPDPKYRKNYVLKPDHSYVLELDD